MPTGYNCVTVTIYCCLFYSLPDRIDIYQVLEEKDFLLANRKDIGYRYLFYKIHTFPKALRVAERAVSGNGGLTQRRRVWHM